MADFSHVFEWALVTLSGLSLYWFLALVAFWLYGFWMRGCLKRIRSRKDRRWHNVPVKKDRRRRYKPQTEEFHPGPLDQDSNIHPV